MRLNTGSRSAWLLLFLLTMPLAREASGQTLVLVREYVYLGDSGKLIAAHRDLTTGAAATPGSLGLPTAGPQVAASGTPTGTPNGVPQHDPLGRSVRLRQAGAPELPLPGQEGSRPLQPATSLLDIAGLYLRPFQYPHAESDSASRLLAHSAVTLSQPNNEEQAHDK